MEATERALFESGVRRATETNDGAALDGALGDLGWRDALAVDRPTAVSVLFETQGATTTTSAALDWLLAAALGADADGGAVAVVLPSLRGWDAPGRLDGDWCVVEGLGTAALGRCDTALVVAQTPDGAATFAVDLGLLTRRPVEGLDPALGLCEVMGEFETAWAAQPKAADWPAAVALGQLALGHELVGAGRTMLELARTHALERMQFGRPIGELPGRPPPAGRDAWSPSRRPPPCSTPPGRTPPPSPPPWPRPSPAARRARVARHCQQVLAGYRLHHRAPAAPLRPAHDRPRSAARLRGRPDPHVGHDVLSSATLPPAFPL